MGESFRSFGIQFMTKVLQSLILDVKFFERIYDILLIEYFDSEPHKFIYEKIQSYFNKYKIAPTLDSIEMMIISEKNETMREQTAEILRAIKKSSVMDMKFIKDQAINFCKNQKMKNALYTSVDLWEKGKYDEIYKLVGEALRAGEESDTGHEYWEDIALESRITKMKRYPIPTGLKHLDEILNGGLSKGELGIICGGVGLGKSFALCSVAKNALLKGLNVLHYTLELYEHQVGLRYDSMLTGIPSQNIPNMIDKVKEKLNSIKTGKLIIKFYPPKQASLNTIRLHITKLQQQGFIPDIIIIDYADLLKSSHRYDQKRFELESIYEDLRALAGELMIPIWSASQVNRVGYNSDIVDITTIAEAFAKAAVADVIITLSRKMEDKLNKSARLFVAKNRAGKDGIVIPMIMDLENFKFETKKPLENFDELKTELEKLKDGAEQELKSHAKEQYEKFQKKKEKNNDKELQ